MNCGQARLLIGADPRSISPDVARHVRSCAACAQLRNEMTALDGNIRRALQQPPPVAILPRPSAFVAVRRHAVAAGVAVMITMITAAWMLRPSDSLAQDVVQHVNSESPSQTSFMPIDAGALQDVLRRSGIQAHITSNEVIHERTCLFRWRFWQANRGTDC